MTVLFISAAAQNGDVYVAAKTGLSVREKPDAAARVLIKIPYGTKLSLPEDTSQWLPISTEGLSGYWRKVNYNNKTGYVVNSYLFPVPPPPAGTKDMRTYLAKISSPFGAKLVVRSGTGNNEEDGGWELQKQLYKNGGEWHRFMGYEYASDTYFVPNFTMQQAFLLLRLLPEFSDVFNEKDEFPLKSKTFSRGDREYRITVDNGAVDADIPWIKKITVEYEAGASYLFEMYEIENQIVIFLSAGV